MKKKIDPEKLERAYTFQGIVTFSKISETSLTEIQQFLNQFDRL